MSWTRHCAALVMAMALVFSGACFAKPRPDSGVEAELATAGPAVLRVLSFNIEWGGANVRFASVVDAVRASGADLVGVQEAEGNLGRLADALGWYYDERSYVVSRYPILDPPNADGSYVYVEIRPGEVVAIANVHLPSDPYGPEWVRDGHPLEEVLELERRLRLPKIQPILDVLPGLANRGIPVFLTGDFNAPSHADWTEAAVGTRPFLTRAVAWPVSRAVELAGFRDSFREAHPDAVAQPGLTWWAKRQRIRDYNPGDGDPRDRIDFLWYAGPAVVISSEIVGEVGAPEVSIAISPWPSDHRGVISGFEVVPAKLPLLIAPQRRLNVLGDSIRIVYNAPGFAAVAVVVSRVSASSSVDPSEFGPVEGGRGSLDLPAGAAGEYRIELRDGTGATLSSNGFWVIDPEAVPAVSMLGSKFSEGEPLPIRWSDGPGNRNDWLAVYGADAPGDSQDPTAFVYVRARSSGELELSDATAEAGWPIAPGRYVVRLLKDDGFELLAESEPFRVE